MSTPPKGLHLENRAVLKLTGGDVRTLLQGLITNDMKKFGPEAPLYAALLTPQGKYLFDFFLYERDGAVLMDCEASRKGALIQRLNFYKLRADVTIEDVSAAFKVFVFQPGPHESTDRFVHLDPRLRDMGYRAVLEETPEGLDPWPLGEYEELRLSLGIPDGSRDIEVDKRFALEANLAELNGVDFKKGCYVGQEMTARMTYRGSLKKRLLPALVEGPLPQPGSEFLSGGKGAGHILSGQNNRAIALTRLEYLGSGPFETPGGAKVSVFTPPWLKL